MTDTTSSADTAVPTIEALVDTYLAGLNETDPAARAVLVAEAWADDGRFLDPLLDATGHEALGTMVGAIHEQYPGHRFRRTTAIDGHHRFHRFGWELAGPDGVLVAGLDIAELAPDGRLAAVTGFFGPLAEEG